MKIELKNVKHARFASEETECFSATVWIDGVKAGDVSNQGHGGCNNYHPFELEKRLNAYGATLPPIVSEDVRDPKDETKPLSYAQDADTLINDLFDAWLAGKEEARIAAGFRRTIKDRILYTKKGQTGIFQTNKLKPATMIDAMANRHKVMQIKDIDVALNFLPQEDALKLYLANIERVVQ